MKYQAVLSLSTLAILPGLVSGVNVLFGNDDGWAATHVRAAFEELDKAGHNVLLSCPAENKSGSGSTEVPELENRTEPCQFDSCPPGSSTGSDEVDKRLNWVNGFPVDGIQNGIENLAPAFFDGAKPDLVVTGPNVGANVGIEAFFSGTVGAAVEATKQGIPAIAFSGITGDRLSFTALTSSPADSTVIAARTYAALARKFVDTVLASSDTSDPTSIVPKDTVINVNFPDTTRTECADPENVKFVLTRIFWNPLGKDVETCGRTGGQLPIDSKTIDSEDGCFASVSVMDAKDKTDATKEVQAVVLAKLEKTLPLVCLP